MKELKNCPMCGGEAMLFVSNGVYVVCIECGIQTPVYCDTSMNTKLPNTISLAIDKWNRRAKDE